MLHRILARHQSLGWLSTFNELFPTQLWLSAFSNLYRNRQLPFRVRHSSLFPKPFEAYKFWEHYLPGFSRRDKPHTAADVPDSAVGPVREVIRNLLSHQGRERFLIKVTGWSRIAYFDRIFPGAKFIFLNREHRSVVSSWVQAGWLDVTSDIGSEKWQWGEVPTKYKEVWRDLGGGPLLSAAVKIQLDLDDIHRNVAQFQNRCYELQYEDLISQPLRQLKKLAEFSELHWSPRFENEINAIQYYDPTSKWKKYLSEQEGRLVIEFFNRTTSPT